jgi:hypothetical protein
MLSLSSNFLATSTVAFVTSFTVSDGAYYSKNAKMNIPRLTDLQYTAKQILISPIFVFFYFSSSLKKSQEKLCQQSY